MQIITKNKRAYFDYEIDKEYEAWIILKWHEAKSIKTSHVNIQDAVILIENREVRIYNMDIPLYEKTSPVLVPHYRPKGKRKLLLNKSEITKIAASLDKPWMVALALQIFVNKGWFIKLKIGIWRRHKKVEKKQIIKERDIKKQMEKDIRSI